MTRHETPAYRLETDRFGYFTLTRKSDGATAYFQGDDATLWRRNMDALEAIKTWNAGNSLDRSFDVLCDGYDCVLEPSGDAAFEARHAQEIERYRD